MLAQLRLGYNGCGPCCIVVHSLLVLHQKDKPADPQTDVGTTDIGTL